ncbi:MAG TPA: hypothetical protein DCM86_15350, partial [Verrucomicrobiales bacterium]|nr:hypothetical protein [Verrucomicrobiales bacterium]
MGERIEDQWPSSNWASIPREVESSDGVRFQISGIVRVTGLAAARVGNWAPPQVVGIPVGGSFDTLHLLHTLEGADRDGTPVLGILLHYEDGGERLLRVGAGVHARGGGSESRGEASSRLADPGSSIAWPPASLRPEHARSGVRLFASRFRNPRPGVAVRTLDFLSLFGQSTPCILGLTFDPPAPRPADPAPPLRGKPARHLESPDLASLRHPLRVTALDEGSGRPLTNAEAFLTIGAGDARFFLDHAAAGSTGEMTLHYNPA